MYGIASQDYPKKDREKIWNKLASEWNPEQLSATCEEIGLDALGEKIALMIGGRLTGRKLLNMDI